METSSKIFIAGHRGMVGSAIRKNMKSKGYKNLIVRSRAKLDLIDQKAVAKYFDVEKPEYVILAAAKVGGILANDTYRAQFIYENLMIQNNIIHQAYLHNVKKLLFLGSSCIYPRDCQQPIKEEYLLSGQLEQTNEPYAIAKIAGIKMCENYYRQYGSNFISLMPTNLYGPNDNFDLKTSHVIPALIRKFHDAKVRGLPSVELWGSGKPKREFLYVDDMAEACVHVLEKVTAGDIYNGGLTHLNVGVGEDITISELAKAISKVVGYRGAVKYDKSKPDGTMRKLLDVTRMSEFGWKRNVDLKSGLEKTIKWFSENINPNPGNIS
jgi:GDP-L-fucose synthase